MIFDISEKGLYSKKCSGEGAGLLKQFLLFIITPLIKSCPAPPPELFCPSFDDCRALLGRRRCRVCSIHSLTSFRRKTRHSSEIRAKKGVSGRSFRGALHAARAYNLSDVSDRYGKSGPRASVCRSDIAKKLENFSENDLIYRRIKVYFVNVQLAQEERQSTTKGMAPWIDAIF